MLFSFRFSILFYNIVVGLLRLQHPQEWTKGEYWPPMPLENFGIERLPQNFPVQFPRFDLRGYRCGWRRSALHPSRMTWGRFGRNFWKIIQKLVKVEVWSIQFFSQVALPIIVFLANSYFAIVSTMKGTFQFISKQNKNKLISKALVFNRLRSLISNVFRPFRD